MLKVTPRVDLAFKKLFGVEENKDLLVSLINSIVSPTDQVGELTLLNPYNPQNFREDKWSILDVKARALDGRLFNIEIQISDDADYDKRALYYWAKLYTEQLQISQDYGLLNKAIGIHILNFISIVDRASYHNVFRIHEVESGQCCFQDLELHTIELKKFNDAPRAELSEIVEKVKTSLDRWVAFLTRHELLNKDQLPEELSDPSLKKALNVLEIMNFTSAEREAYEGHLKWLMVEANTLKKAEEKGIEKGMEKGMEKGIEQGRIEGKVAFIKMLLDNGHSMESIAKLTGLTKDQINKLLAISFPI